MTYNREGKAFVTTADGGEAPLTGYAGQVRHGYMCAVDFADETGAAPSTGPICRDLETLRAAKPCISECGWVRVLLVGVEFGEVADAGVPE